MNHQIRPIMDIDLIKVGGSSAEFITRSETNFTPKDFRQLPARPVITSTADSEPSRQRQGWKIRRLALVLSSMCVSWTLIHLVVSLQSSSSSSQIVGEVVSIYDFPPDLHSPPHLTPIDPSTLRPRETVSIDIAHRTGRAHIGSYNVLLLQRSKFVVTCSGTWSALGEHANVDEGPVDTVIWGVEEELGHRAATRAEHRWREGWRFSFGEVRRSLLSDQQRRCIVIVVVPTCHCAEGDGIPTLLHPSLRSTERKSCRKSTNVHGVC